MDNRFRKRTYNVAEAARAGLTAARALPWFVRAHLPGFTLAPAERESIILAVSTVNECRHCRFAHSVFGAMAGLSDEDIALVTSVDPRGIPRRQWLGQFAGREYAAHGAFPDDPEFRRELAEHYSAEEIHAVYALPRVMVFANRLSNTVDMTLEHLAGKTLPREDITLPGELLLTLVWATGAAPVAMMVYPLKWWLKLKQSRSINLASLDQGSNDAETAGK